MSRLQGAENQSPALQSPAPDHDPTPSDPVPGHDPSRAGIRPGAWAVLRLLSDGRFHSGEGLARQLGVSRVTVFNLLTPLAAAGVELQRVRGRGYRLAQPLPWLDADRVFAALGPDTRCFHLEIADEVESTNAILLAEAAVRPPGAVLAARRQTAGRGRRGRAWQSGPGEGLAFSLLWRFPQGARHLAGLSLAVGVALLRGLRAAGLDGLALKWPNDVLHHDRKLAGILIELRGDVLGPSTAVIGVGLNLCLSGASRSRIDQAVADCASVLGHTPDASRLLAEILRALRGALAEYATEGFRAFQAEWQQHHAHADRDVTLRFADGSATAGRATGVSEEGELLVDTASGPRRFASGEISLRPAP